MTQDPGRDPPQLSSAAPQNYLDWAAQQQVFESMAAIAGGSVTLREPGAEPEDLRVQRVTASFFDVLRIRPAIGRAFEAQHEVAGRERTAMLSDGLWRRRFGADPSIVGRVIPLEGGASSSPPGSLRAHSRASRERLHPTRRRHTNRSSSASRRRGFRGTLLRYPDKPCKESTKWSCSAL